MGGKCWGGWSFFFVRDLEISPAGRSSMAAQRDFYLSALASAYDLRAWHFAVLLSIALACSFGCGPSSVLCRRFEAFSFFFSEKNDEDTFLADFLKKMATAWDGCTAAQQLSCRSDWALLVQLCSQPCRRERLRENMEIRGFVGVSK